MRKCSTLALLLALGVVVAGGGAGTTAGAATEAAAACSPARVQYSPHPGGDGRLGMSWIRGKPRRVGAIGLLWYWPSEWRDQRVRTARIFTGGKAPAGYSTKIQWLFVARSAVGRGGPSLLIRGERLDGLGSFSDEFTAISYSGQRGAPSYASIVNVPEPGCWRLHLSTDGLRASLVLLAVDPAD